MPHNQQAIKQTKRDCRHDEKIHRRDAIGMIVEERLPPLRWRAKASQRADGGAAIPSNAKGGPTPKAVGDLLADGLLEELRAKDMLPVWRRGADDLPMALRITPRGLKAIRVEDTISQAGLSNTLGTKVMPERGNAKSVAGKTKISSRSPKPSKLPAARARNAGSGRALA